MSQAERHAIKPDAADHYLDLVHKLPLGRSNAITANVGECFVGILLLAHYGDSGLSFHQDTCTAKEDRNSKQ